MIDHMNGNVVNVGTIFKDHCYSHIPRCPICYPFEKSKPQKEIFYFIELIYSGKIIENDRSVLEVSDENNWKRNHEIDILLPDIMLGIEFNGIFYHKLNR